MELVTSQVVVGTFQVLHLSGEVDLATLPRLSDALTKLVASATSLAIVDLDGLSILDDTGLGLLLGAAGRARQGGAELVVVCSAPTVRSRLSLTGFDRAVRVTESISAIG